MNWEEFLEALKQRMSKEGAEWKQLPRKEELVLWWRRWGREKIGEDAVYLQIHARSTSLDGDHFLAYRVGTPCKDGAYQKRLRDDLTELLMKVVAMTPVAKNHGWDNCITPPKRPGRGQAIYTMKFGVTTGDQSCWLARNPNNGTPDVDRTVQNLRKGPAPVIVQAVAKLYRLAQ